MKDKILKILTKYNINKIDNITETTSIHELGVDSLGLMQLLCECEDNLGVEFQEEDYPEIKTINDLIVYAESKGVGL